jgi:hypothetical protein
MEWIKKHAYTCVIISSIAASILWMNGKFNDIERDIYGLKTDIAVMKTVLIMNDIMPKELAKSNEIINHFSDN